ncbi:DUF262 domain-containing protein [Tenacibaculum dicentrarchi]|nr:DUF262 domain-containing protein [Tenacibaculum dicentrarchi]
MEELTLEKEVNTSVNNTPLQVVSCTLKELLNCANENIPGTKLKGQLTIPEYQRPYVWQEKQINQLLNDYLDYNLLPKAGKPLYYLGSIILHNHNGQLKIIDGQQRITTALLFQKIKNPAYKSGIRYNNTLSINNIKHNLSYIKSIHNEEIFEFKESTPLNAINFKDINVTLIVTSTEDLAYTFFETQNTGGVRLSGSDILKAHHLRALPNRKLVNYQAKRWETINSTNLERIVELLTKIRFWDNRKWRRYPFYRDKRGIKSAIIDEYTINTKNNIQDISYYYSTVKNDNGRKMQMHESKYKQIKQPLTNGNNTLDYVNEYVELYEILFGASYHHDIDEDFYHFNKKVLHGNNGTIFLKELFQISIIAYVSRFGFYRMFEASLWLYRVIFSLRVSSNRNVREDSIFKFVYEKQFIDNIIQVFTPDELFLFLKKFRYNFNIMYIENGHAKKNHINTLRYYFGENNINEVTYYKDNPTSFDQDFVKAIRCKLKPTKHV